MREHNGGGSAARKIAIGPRRAFVSRDSRVPYTTTVCFRSRLSRRYNLLGNNWSTLSLCARLLGWDWRLITVPTGKTVSLVWLDALSRSCE
jgi:hypothetical protein